MSGQDRKQPNDAFFLGASISEKGTIERIWKDDYPCKVEWREKVISADLETLCVCRFISNSALLCCKLSRGELGDDARGWEGACS
jgi:hypothetical protein